jgi:hypothetical protein
VARWLSKLFATKDKVKKTKQLKFQEDLAACSKISHKYHSKKMAPSTAHASAREGRPMIEGRIPYGLGVIAGPNTIVAGSRAGIKFGFEVSSHKNSTGRSTAAERIALGTYGAEELQSMFGDSLASTTNRTTKL